MMVHPCSVRSVLCLWKIFMRHMLSGYFAFIRFCTLCFALACRSDRSPILGPLSFRSFCLFCVWHRISCARMKLRLIHCCIPTHPVSHGLTFLTGTFTFTAQVLEHILVFLFVFLLQDRPGPATTQVHVSCCNDYVSV